MKIASSFNLFKKKNGSPAIGFVQIFTKESRSKKPFMQKIFREFFYKDKASHNAFSCFIHV